MVLPVQIRLSRLVHDNEAAAFGGEVFDVVHGGEEEDVVLLKGFRRPVIKVKETLFEWTSTMVEAGYTLA